MKTFSRFLLFAILPITLVSCGFESPSTSNLKVLGTGIIRGTDTAPEAAITRATVLFNKPNGKFCTGVLLNDHVVLTAAHCVTGLNPGPGMFVYVPETNKSCFSANVTEISEAPKVNPKDNYPPDLALLKLNRAICNTPTVTFAPTPQVNQVVTAAGFGEGSTPGLPDFMNLKVIRSDKTSLRSLYLNGYEKDSDVLEDWKLVDENYDEFSSMYLFALATQPEQSLCHGDSGGPVYQEQNGALTVYGVIGGGFPHSKKGVGSCQNTYLQMFAPIGPSIQWLEGTLKRW